MTFKLSQRSRDRLVGVHPDLVKVVERAIQISPVDFGITEGLRTQARQKELVAAGASKTMNSRHITGHAVDVAAYLGREMGSHRFRLIKKPPKGGYSIGLRISCQPLQSGQ